MGSSERGSREVQPAERAEEEEGEVETVCEECGRGDREHLLLLCDSCDRGYHTSCLTPALARVPPGSWHCQDCSLVRTPSRRRPAVTRTGQLERIRAVVDSVRRELERRFPSHVQQAQPARASRSRRGRGKANRKSKKVGKRKKAKCRRGRHSIAAVTGAVVENVRAALGIGESVYNERPVPLTLFGNYNDLEPLSDHMEEEEEERAVFSSGVSARVMPRHLAVERINLARRRRMKAGVEISPAPDSTPDILGGIIDSQTSLFTRPCRQLRREKGRGVVAAVTASTDSGGQGGQGAVKKHHSQETTGSNSSSSSNTSNTSNSSSVPQHQQGSGTTISNCLLSSEGEKTEENNTAEFQADTSDLAFPAEIGLNNLVNPSQKEKPEQSESEIYDPENPGDASGDENLVIDDTSTDQNNIPMSHNGSESTDSKPNKIKISLTTSSKGTPQKKSIISDIFGSDEEMPEPGDGDGDSTPVRDERKDIAEEENNSENYSDVSDKEIDEAKNERDLSVSPINSDQSESYEKAATLEGLNPEAISPEEDFTSLSEEEEGEIKNYEKRKQLKLKKRELQKKVKELERQVIEISPDAPLDLNGILEDGEINDKDKKGKKKVKENAKLKRKNKKKLKVSKEKAESNNKPKDGVVGETKNEKNEKVSGRNYRKKKSNNEDEETDEKSPLVKRKDSKMKDKSKKPELQRYDVRRILDAKKEQKEKDKSGDGEASKGKENGDANKDEFGRDLSKKEKEKKKKPSSRSRSRGRKLSRRSRKRSTSSSSSLSLSSSSSSSNSSSSSSSSRSRSRSRKKGKVKGKKAKETTKNKKIVIKKKLPVAENIRKKMRSRSRSRNKRKRKPSESGSRSRSRSRGQKRKKVRVKEKSKPRSKSRSVSKKRGKSKQLKNGKTRRRSTSRSRSRSKSRKTRAKQRNRSPSKSSKSKETKEKSESSPSEKSVFTSGDKIMVSVNFPDKSEQGNAKDRPEKEKSSKTKANQKPSVIIDLLDDNESYKVIEQEKELVDIASDNEKENTAPSNQEAASAGGDLDPELAAKGPMTPPEPERFTDRYDPFDPTVSPDNEPESLPVESQVTPPLQPSTPPGPPSESPTAAPSSPGVKLAASPKLPNSNQKRR